MDLLQLKDIGKIYVSENNVAVGIRSVNLTFNKGEFVAITGESGSGKSTLLNVISGMDTYEEGELLINGDATSHYIQNDWEEYRKNYISFIFQNYNIIDSFTVLQNVELALMHIESSKERRIKALELIEKVGMTSHINHKGSKLSGGQKQRTVIARALAKDSPIILADEPTGNLDSKTSKEIIELLHEVSKDKLLIIVTHNFDEVKDYATRHIRVFDGQVEYDKTLKSKNIVEDNYINNSSNGNKIIKNGFILGKSIFLSKPKLSIFLSLLLMIGLIGIFLTTSIFGGSLTNDKNYMFNYNEGRVVITKYDGTVISDDELNTLKNKYNAVGYTHYDLLLDSGSQNSCYYYFDNVQKVNLGMLNYKVEKYYGNNIIGQYPVNDNEVFLYLPISKQPEFGKNEIIIKNIYINNCKFNIVGIKYFYDNNLDGEILLTNNGFRYATASNFLMNSQNKVITVETMIGNNMHIKNINSFSASFDLDNDKVYINKKLLDNTSVNDKTKVSISISYKIYNYIYGLEKDYLFNKDYTNITTEAIAGEIDDIIISPYLLIDTVEEVLAKSYKQASLFFKNDKLAQKVIDDLKKDGYNAISSDTTFELDADEVILNMILNIVLIGGWLLSIVFIAFFINLCSHKSLQTFKDDISIMRSMGISKNAIKVGMYVRMFMALIPGIVILTTLSLIIFRSPNLNELFDYLYGWQYLLIVLGMIFLIYRITKKQIHKIFNVSVKESLKGGAN